MKDCGFLFMSTSLIQLNPSIFPSTISICIACGSLGSPGIRKISPAMATIISAPLLITISLMWNSKLFTAPYIFGSAEKEY